MIERDALAMWRVCCALLLALAAAFGAAAEASDYDPSARLVQPQPAIDLQVVDAARQREIPLRVYLPASDQPAPVLMFSHGLGGSRENNGYLGEHWASRGYAVFMLQHPGSDEGLWRDQPLGRRRQATQAGASSENFRLRVGDVSAVLDQLARWAAEDEHPLSFRLDLDKVGMSGHSFGAVTTQAVSGQSFRGRRLTDPRIDAAVLMSPSPPRGGSAGEAFGRVDLPWLLMTGTRDEGSMGGASAAERLMVYPALPRGSKYELVLNDAEHSAFSDRSLPGEADTRHPNHHRAILALSTAFWDAYLKQDLAARAWLDGDGPGKVLDPQDRWQHK